MNSNYSLSALVAVFIFSAFSALSTYANDSAGKARYNDDVTVSAAADECDKNAVMHYDYTDQMYYDVYTAPGSETVIQLEPGERIVQPVYLQSPENWDVSVKDVQQDGQFCQHVAVTCSECASRSIMEIATDRRSYIIDLNSFEGSYMQVVKWNYLHETSHQTYAENR